MEACPFSASNTSSTNLSDPSSSPPQAVAPPQVILSPCAACKFLRRRCVEKCVLAPYFPPTEPLNFAVVHRVFGASNIIKWLQELPEDQRADAINSMVFEAKTRLRDPIYGCVGVICHLQNQISELQVELAKAQVEILNMKCQNATLSQLISKQILTTQSVHQENILLNQISELPAKFAKVQAEILNMQCQNATSFQLISTQALTTRNVDQENINLVEENSNFFVDDRNLGAYWGSL